MGYRYEVSAWLDTNGFRYVQLYVGKSLIKSIIIMLISKRSGCGCVKLEWMWVNLRYTKELSVKNNFSEEQLAAEIDRLNRELEEASTIANNNYEVILKCNRQINDLKRELACYRNGVEVMDENYTEQN